MGPLELGVDDLVLDVGNPRFGSAAAAERDALEKLLVDQREKLLALAESIAESGLNPMDRFLVVKDVSDPSRYIALEGNRRVAALKILTNPNLLSGLPIPDRLRVRFDRLATTFDRSKVEPIPCFEVADRDEGTPWLLLRHTGENEGRGVVGWSSVAVSRFRGRDPALQALELVRLHGALTDQQAHSLGQSFPITTLDRLLSTPEVRRRIGLDITNRKLRSGLPPQEFMKPLRRVVLDLATKAITVSRLKTKTEQLTYVDAFAAADRADLSKAGVVRVLDEIDAAEFRSRKSPKQSSKRGRSDPSDRRTIVPRGCSLAVTDSKTSEIFHELRSLRIDTYPHSISVLLRVFLELSLDHYMRSNRLPAKRTDSKTGRSFDLKLTDKVQAVVSHLVSAGANAKDFLGIRRAVSVEHSPLHIDLLHGYVHNRFVIPKARDLTGAWDESQGLFERIWP